MSKFLVDVNLPYFFKLWKNSDYIFQRDINASAKDEDIWNYALEQNLTIITKDSDFSNKILLRTPPPKVIHIKTGNMKMNDFHAFINRVWPEVLALNENHKMVSVFNERIEAIE